MWNREPVLIALAALDGVVVAGLVLAGTLGIVDLPAETIAGVGAFVVAVTGMVAAILRGQVWAPESHDLAVTDALFTPTVDTGERAAGVYGGAMQPISGYEDIEGP